MRNSETNLFVGTKVRPAHRSEFLQVKIEALAFDAMGDDGDLFPLFLPDGLLERHQLPRQLGFENIDEACYERVVVTEQGAEMFEIDHSGA